MLDFRPITINDREKIQSFFSKSTFRNCDFSFSNIFSWQHFYKTKYAVENDCLYFRFSAGKNNQTGYMFPLGAADLKKAIERIMLDAEENKSRLVFFSITRDMFDLIEGIMPGQFIYTPERDWFEYIYSSEDLISLSGKKFQAKRNHINKFKRTYEWEFLPITREIIPDCLDLYERWCKENGGCKTEQSLIEEHIATKKVFENYGALDLKGAALRIDGQIQAYSYGQALTADTFGVHAEKSLYEIDGGFTMMNQQFAEHYCRDYKYINREEDLGYESLRQAKMSYHPVILLEKGALTLK